MNVLKVGSYIRDQRVKARLSLRNMSRLAGVSIPYLSQVERGLRKPSAEILQAIAKGLRISAETLYVQAGFLEDRPVPDVASAIVADTSITERHRQALLQIYQAFRDEAGRVPASEASTVRGTKASTAKAASSTTKATNGSTAKATKGSTAKATKGSTAKATPKRRSPNVSTAARANRAGHAAARRGGRAETEAARSLHPAPLRPSAITT